MTEFKNELVLISGKSSTGKSSSLRDLVNPEGVIYINCEGKRLPFVSKFKEIRINHPNTLYKILQESADHASFHTIVIDSLTFLMDMYESLVVLKSSNTQKAWGEYNQYFKNLMYQYVYPSKKDVIFLAHTGDDYNQAQAIVETSVKIKGSLKDRGIESFFTSVVSTKKVSLRELEEYGSPLLNITNMDQRLGYKYVIQTMPTKDTCGERIRNPMDMWSFEETFIDNSAQAVMDRIKKYYKGV